MFDPKIYMKTRNYPAFHALVLIPLLLATSLTPCVAGDIEGVATDANTGRFLSNTIIEIPKLNRSTVADTQGKFSMTNLPAGVYVIYANYLGYEPVQTRVTVPAEGDVSVTIKLGEEVVHMEAYVVEGHLEGRSQAMQEKRAALNMIDVISADVAGNLPDRNVAEALGRIAGVSMSLEGGEGQYLTIRGMEPNLNQITMDGATMAAPGGAREGRAIPLDVLSASRISRLQVIKTVTPDMDGNSIGGTVNIKTVSAFDSRSAFMRGSAQIHRNDLRDKDGMAFDVIYANKLGKRRNVGFAVSSSFDRRHTANDFVKAEDWVQITNNDITTYVTRALELRPTRETRDRWGATLNLEYKPDKSTELYIRPNYTHGVRESRSEQVNYGATNASGSTVTLTSDKSGTYAASGVSMDRRELRGKKVEDLFNVTAGAKKKWANLTLEPVVSYSLGQLKQPQNESLIFRTYSNVLGGIDFSYDDFSEWTWNVDPQTYDPEKFFLRYTRQDPGKIKEEIYTAKLDARIDFYNVLKRAGFIKTGIKYIARTRDSEMPSYRLTRASGKTWTLADVGPAKPGTWMYNDHYFTGMALDWDKTWDYINNNPLEVEYMLKDSMSNTIQDAYSTTEDIYAAYIMGSINLTKNGQLLAGIRWERTRQTISAYEFRSFGGAFLGIFPQAGLKTYDSFLPNVQYAYKLAKRFIFRAAMTQTIGRPSYDKARPYSTFDYNFVAGTVNPDFPNRGTLKVGNPDLKAYKSMNFDIGMEYYAKNGGVYSIAFFQKNIDNPIYEYRESQYEVVYNGVALDSLSIQSYENAKDGKIQGLEIGIYQPLRMLPGFLNGFGFEGNITFIDSKVDVPLRPDEKFKFFRQPDLMANAAIFYERGKLSTRLAYRYEDGSLNTISAMRMQDIYRCDRFTMDFQFRFRFTRNFSLVFAVRNLTSETEDTSVYSMERRWMYSSQVFGRDYSLAANVQF